MLRKNHGFSVVDKTDMSAYILMISCFAMLIIMIPDGESADNEKAELGRSATFSDSVSVSRGERDLPFVRNLFLIPVAGFWRGVL